MQANATDSDIAQKSLGVYITQGLGSAYPELKRLSAQLFAERVAKIPWLPESWLGDVNALQARFPADLVRIAPSRVLLVKSPMAPAWLDSPAKVDAWQELFTAHSAIVANFARGEVDKGRAELERVNADAEFWDRLYRIAVSVRDAVPNAVGGIVSNFIRGIGWKWGAIIVIGGIGAVYLYRKSLLSKLRKL